MSPHGCDRDGIVTISTKIEKTERNKLDLIKKTEAIKNTINLIRKIISNFLKEFEQKGHKTSKRRKKPHV